MSAPEYARVADLARRSGLSERTIMREIADGTLPAIRVRRCVLVRLSDFDAYLAARRIGGGNVVSLPTVRRMRRVRGGAA